MHTINQQTSRRRRFEILPCGDPYSRTWDVREFVRYSDDTCVYRGDLSGRFGRRRLRTYLRRAYPGCQILVRANYR